MVMGKAMVTPTPPFQTKGGMVGMKVLPTYPPQEYLASGLGFLVGMPRPPSPRRGTWVAGPSHCEVCHEEKAMAQHAHHPTLGLGILKADSTLANTALKLFRHVCKPSRGVKAATMLTPSCSICVLSLSREWEGGERRGRSWPCPPPLQYYLVSCLGIVVEMTSPPSQEEGGVESGQTQDVAYALLPCFPSKNLGIAIPTILLPT